jgi:NifU-like protein involved in Fe-S cluster formation
MNAPLYTLDILRLAAEIPHREPLTDAHGSADKRAPLCGSRVRVEVRLDGEGRVDALSQQVQACAFGQAAASLMGAHAIGRDLVAIAGARRELADWLAGRSDDPGEWPGLDVLAPARSKTARHGAMLIPFEALEEAVREAGKDN